MTKQDIETITTLDQYIGRRLREKRQKLGLTLSYVAEKLDISHQQIQKYETAQSRISAAHLYKLALLMGIAPSYFFDGYDRYLRTIKKDSNGHYIPHASSSFNVLLAENDPADELLLRRALETAVKKVNILCLHSGEQVIEFLRHRPLSFHFPRPNLILLNMRLPGRDGKTLLKEVKRDRELQDIPVIMLAEKIDPEDIMNVYKGCAAGYISKAIKFDELQRNLQIMINYWSQAVLLPVDGNEEAICSEESF